MYQPSRETRKYIHVTLQHHTNAFNNEKNEKKESVVNYNVQGECPESFFKSPYEKVFYKKQFFTNEKTGKEFFSYSCVSNDNIYLQGKMDSELYNYAHSYIIYQI